MTVKVGTNGAATNVPTLTVIFNGYSIYLPVKTTRDVNFMINYA